MLIFIDTNIFFNHWFLRAPLFELLANYVSNERANLLVSEVVCEEMNAKFYSERAAASRELNNMLRRANNFQSISIEIAAPALDEAYDFRKVLTARFQNLCFFPFDQVPHSLLVPRAISSTRPFRDGEKGYRDSLMWLSLLSVMKEQYVNAEKLVFINANSKDFFNGNTTDLTLHPDLEADWVREGLTGIVKPFLSLKEFADAEIDKVLHSIRHEEFEDRLGREMERLAEEAAVDFLQWMPLPDAQIFLEHADVPRRCARVIRSVNVEVFEGVEDPEVLSLSALTGGALYVKYLFNLRIVIFTVQVSTDDYLANRDEFDEEFMNIDMQERLTQLETFRRIDFEASLTFNINNDEFTSVSIDSAITRPVR